MKKFSLIIPVRLNSRRIKNKIFAKIGNYTVIDILLKRIKFLPLKIDVIFSISKHRSSLKFIKFCPPSFGKICSESKIDSINLFPEPLHANLSYLRFQTIINSQNTWMGSSTPDQRPINVFAY
jgi:hypothetical protein